MSTNWKGVRKADSSRVTDTAIEHYRTNWPDRCEALDDNALRARLATEEAKAPEVELDAEILDRAWRRTGKNVRFLSSGNPWLSSCNEPVFLSAKDGLVTVFDPPFWRKTIAEYIALGFRIYQHCLDRYQQRFDPEATYIDVAHELAYTDLQEWTAPDEMQKSDADDSQWVLRGRSRIVVWCRVNPEQAPSAGVPIFVGVEQEDSDAGPLHPILSVLTGAMFQNKLAMKGATQRIQLPARAWETISPERPADDDTAVEDPEPGNETSMNDHPAPVAAPAATDKADTNGGHPTHSAPQPPAGPAPIPGLEVTVRMPLRASDVALLMADLMTDGTARLTRGDVTVLLEVTDRRERQPA